MKSFEWVVQSFLGIHAQSAMRLVKEAHKYTSMITVVCGERKANARNIMELMELQAKQGSELTIIIDGEDEDLATDGMKMLCRRAV